MKKPAPVFSKFVALALGIQSAWLPVSTAHAAHQCDVPGPNSRKALVAQIEHELEDNGQDRKVSFRDNARRAITIAEIELNGAREFYATVDGIELLVKSEISDGEIKTTISTREGGKFTQIHESEYRAGESAAQIETRLRAEIENEKKIQLRNAPLRAGVSTFFFLGLLAAVGISRLDASGEDQVFLGYVAIMGCLFFSVVARHVTSESVR